ncbi:hypothetical protein [Austwickia chelonae]|uniref:hypothetical protein n=1 Tax=Austwickia chelonae TaxID=100225 RepID=UPI0013C2C08C|nr:hypothetical protein [Austwickia chelonae]
MGAGRGHAVSEGGGEGVQGGLPAHAPAGLAGGVWGGEEFGGGEPARSVMIAEMLT